MFKLNIISDFHTLKMIDYELLLFHSVCTYSNIFPVLKNCLATVLCQ